jgi:hypothetical protein
MEHRGYVETALYEARPTGVNSARARVAIPPHDGRAEPLHPHASPSRPRAR